MPPSPPDDRHHIVFFNQFFWPDSAPTGVLLEDAARHLVAQGHRVTVVCGPVGYTGIRSDAAPPVEIVRLPALRFRHSSITRMLSWVTFLLGATREMVRFRNADLFVTMTTPPGLSIPAALIGMISRFQLWIWEMDVYPDVALTTGALSPSVLTSILGSVFTWSRRRAHGIIALGECMRDRLLESGLAREKIHILHNWVDPSHFTPAPMPGFTMLRLLYSGNLGRAHDAETLLGALPSWSDEGTIHVTVAGSGSSRPSFEQRCETLSNLTFLPFGDLEELERNLGASHIGLVTIKKGCEGTVVPSKVYSILAAGRPILFIGPAASSTTRLVQRHACGWHIEPEDIAGLRALCSRLQLAPEEVRQAGIAARAAMEGHYSLERGVSRIHALLLPVAPLAASEAGAAREPDPLPRAAAARAR